MSDNASIPSDADIQQLQQKLDQAKKHHYYQQLKQELHAMSRSQTQARHECEGVMQMPDAHLALKTKRFTHAFFDVLFDRLKGMFSLRPVIGHIIALSLSIFVLYYIYHEVDLAGFAKYKHYFGIGAQLAGALTIIKSSTRSLILPVTALVFGGIVAHSLNHHATLFHFGTSFYESLMIVGIIGTCFSVMTID